METDGGLFVDESSYHQWKAVQYLCIYLCMSVCEVCHSLTSKKYIFENKKKDNLFHMCGASKQSHFSFELG